MCIRDRLHAHHVVHWAKGGETSLDNLVSLCHFHHHTVHEGGWNVKGSQSGWAFIDKKGNVARVPVLRLVTDEPLPEAVRIRESGSAEPLFETGEPCDPGYVADTLMGNWEVDKRAG